MENQNSFKRVSKHPSEQTKLRISRALAGKPKSEHTKQLIAQSMRDYWSRPENFPADYRHEGSGRGYVETGDVV